MAMTEGELHAITDAAAGDLIAELEKSGTPAIALGRLHAKVGLHFMLAAEGRESTAQFHQGIVDYLCSRKDH